MNTDNKLVPAAIICSVAIIISVVILAYTWHSNYLLNQTISVTGSATQNLTSDIGYINAQIEATAPTALAAYNELQQQKPTVTDFFVEHGFSRDEVVFKTANSYSREDYDSNGRPTGEIISWTYSQQVEVKSSDVQLIQRLSLQLGSLVQKGITIQVNPPEYYYSKLDSLKVQIQSKAAKNAMQRARKISQATGQELGKLTSADMGVLQITPVNSNAVSSLGLNDNTSIKKEITGVVAATFQIK